LPQANARLNSGVSAMGPRTRNGAGECGSDAIWTRMVSGVALLRQPWAKAMKKRWSAVKPSIFSGCGLAVSAYCSAR